MSRFLDYTTPAPQPDPKIAHLTRHLSARVGEFFCAQIDTNQDTGTLSVVFEGFPPDEMMDALRQREVLVLGSGGSLVFHLTTDHVFEDIDFLWSVLYAICC